MIDNIQERVAAILLTAILLFSATFVIPAVNVSAASETNDIEIPVLDNSLAIVTNAYVKLTEVHTGSIVTASYDSSISAYKAANAPSGYYRIDVTATGYYNFKDVTGFEFTGMSSYTKPSPVILTKYGNMIYTYTVNVKDGSSTPITGATVKFYDRTAKQELVSTTTNATGVASLQIFGGTSLDLVVSAMNYEMNVTAVGVISGHATKNITLITPATIISGFAYKQGGGIANNVVAYLYNTNQSIPWEKRVLKSTGSFVRFDAYPDNWILVIDGSDVDPYIANKTVVGNELLALSLLPQNQSSEENQLDLNSWNQIDISTSAVWRADKAYSGLDYSDMGCLRAQVDLAHGNGDGIVSNSEWVDFVTLISTHGPNYVTTSSILHLDDGNSANRTQFANRTVNSQSISNFAGSVTNLASVTYTSDVSYSTQVTIPAADTYYAIQFVAKYDTVAMKRIYNLTLVSGYELVDNDTLTDKVKVLGYETVTIDPQLSATSGSESITLHVQKSEEPTVRAEIVTGEQAYAKRNETNVLLYYVVKNSTAVTFSGDGSTDPNGNPLSYIWDFGDGATETTMNKTTTHNYTAGAHNLTVSLTVQDVTMKTNMTTFILSVDSLAPTVKLNVYNTTMAPKTGAIVTIDQHDLLKFNPNGTIDDLKNVSDGLGEISYYEWQFGNETPIQRLAEDTANITVTEQFDVAGDIKVVLNVTDVVGNWKNASVTIRVNDKTGPNIVISRVLNSTWGTSLIERKTIYIDASTTTDNIDDIADLHFEWKFGDGDTVSGNGTAFANVSHVYNTYGQYNILLNVTDLSGNNASLPRTLYIGAGPRPNLEPINLTFNPSEFEEGVAGTITVWMTNDGSAAAKENITVEIWLYSGTTPKEKLGTITQFRYANGSIANQVGIEDEVYGTFTWTPSAMGNYTIRAIANCTDQSQSNWESATVEVNEAGWKKIALYVGIIVIVIVIPLLLIARKRIATMGGLRRERPIRELKEKKKEREKDKEKD